MTDVSSFRPPSAPPAPSPRRARTFVGRLSGAVRRQDGFAVALEVCIVVAGVLLALAANDWAAGRAARRVEAQSLREVRAALQSDLADIRSVLEGNDQVAAPARELRDHFRARRPYHDSLDARFGAILSTTYSTRDLGAYETLKQRGLDTVTDDSLRAAINHLYGVTYPSGIVFQEWGADFFLQEQVPLYNRLFHDVHWGRSATPTDYDALLGSNEFAAVLDWRVDLERQLAEMMRRTESEVEALIGRIDRVLARR